MVAECLTVTTADMDALVRAFFWLLFAAIAVPELLRIDFEYWEWRVRRHFRRKRLARIRAAKAVTRA